MPSINPRLPDGWHSDRGAVTAEFVLVIPAVIVVLAMLVFGFRVGLEQQQLQAFVWRESRALSMPGVSYPLYAPQGSGWVVRVDTFADRLCVAASSNLMGGLDAYQCAPIYTG